MTIVTHVSSGASACGKAHSYEIGQCMACRIAYLELGLRQIINGCVDDGDEANAYFRLSPAELRRVARSALDGNGL